MRHSYLPIVLCILFTFDLTGQNDIQLVRYPAIAPDGSQIAFSFQGDIWTASIDGGIARRLTIHESYESHPQWSLDGNQIVFQGNRFGNNDIFVINSTGSRPDQLTYHPANDGAAKWGPEGQLFFNSRRAFQQVERIGEIYATSLNGGTPSRALSALGNNPSPSPDGRYIAFERGSCRIAREAYRGPANRDIWVYDTTNKTYTQITTDEGQDIYPNWGPDNQLYFLSAQNGRYNIHQVKIENGQTVGSAKALTNFTDEGIRFFDVSSASNWLVFERMTDFFKMSTDNNTPEKITLDLTQDYRFDPEESRTFTNRANNYKLSPDGKYLAINVRGEIFVTPADKDKKRSHNLSQHAYRDENADWLNDSTLVFLSDRDGTMALHLVKSSDPNEVSLFKTLKLETKKLSNVTEEEMRFQLSPDKKKIALQRGRGKLIIADISEDGLSNEVVLRDGWATADDVSWSPDSKWIAYAYEDLYFNEEIYIHAADNSSEPVNISLHPRGDHDPVWSADGSKLAFLSNRNNRNDDVWFVWLKKSDWEKTQRDWEEDEEPDTKDKKKDKKSVEVSIDFEDIHERLVQVTNEPGNEGSMVVSKDGQTFYFTTNRGGREGQSGVQSLKSIEWDGSKLTTVLNKRVVAQLSWDKAGKSLYMLNRGGTLAKMSVANKKVTSLPFQAVMDINHMEERKQVFGDAWKTLKYGFYDPNFHGNDWNALKAKYEPRALAATTVQDFRFMFNEMLGQVNASHMGLRGFTPEDVQNKRAGLLGIEVKSVSDGVEILTIIKDTPADRSESKLNAGDIIHSVNGTDLDNNNLYDLLTGTVNERVLLGVSNPSGESREVIIRPTRSINTALYEAWVDDRKALTNKYSNGRLGYIHIRGMNWSSFERFERELTASGLGKDGMVIDVRFNGGGWTTDMLMTVLNVRQHSYTVPRGAAKDLDQEHKSYTQYYPYGERLPFSSLVKPSIAMCNENSYSNAEIFSHAYKTLDLGTLVGQPTFGAVISTGGRGMIDGSFVRLPFRAWYVKATEQGMEHGPAVPDIIVENAPDSKANGEDPQLQKAVEVLLQQIDEAKVKAEEDRE